VCLRCELHSEFGPKFVGADKVWPFRFPERAYGEPCWCFGLPGSPRLTRSHSGAMRANLPIAS